MRFHRSSPLLLSAMATFVCVACVTPGDSSRSEAALARIADQCALQRSVFTLIGPDELRFRPSPDDSYESVSCALEKIRADNRLRIRNMGFVGNEGPSENESNAQAH